MRKKDYELIAGVFRAYFVALHEGPVEDTSISAFGERMAEILEETQPKFDRQKFLTACGIYTVEDFGNSKVYVDQDGIIQAAV